MDRIKIVIIVVAICSIFTAHAHAAEITFDSSIDTVAVGDTVVFHVLLNTDTASVNAVDLGILYPKNLGVQTISKAGSFIQIWLKEPSYTSDVVFLSGGAPGGINAKDVIVATIVFEAKSVGDGALGLSPTSAVLLNDGSGTQAPISLQTKTIHVVARKANQNPKTSVQDASATRTKSDFVAPQGFTPLIGSDPTLFKGKYFISFLSTDSGSGIDHYEIKEGDNHYTIARSPYLLSDQTLHSVIHIKAFDAAGNVREETYPGIFKRLWWWISKYIIKLRS